MRIRPRGARYAMLATLVVVLSACGSDDEALVTTSAGTGFFVNAESAGTMDVTGITWVEPCHDQGGGQYRTATMIVAVTGSGTGTEATGTRTEADYSDPACTTETSSDTFDFSVSNDGEKNVVDYVDGAGNVVSAPAGFTLPTTATKATISGTDAQGPFSFTTILYVNDLVTPNEMLFGDTESPSAVIGADGYPDNMVVTGIVRQN